MIERIAGARADVLSLDFPSGLDPDTGATEGVYVTASATLTLYSPKPGLVNPAAGAVRVADLGIPAEVNRRAGVEPPCYGRAFVERLERA